MSGGSQVSTGSQVSSVDGANGRDAVGTGALEVEERARAGERILTLLATPLNVMILRALAQQPMRLAQLRQATGLPAQTTLRGHLSTLTKLGAVSKRPTAQMPYAVENELTQMGADVLAVAERLEGWLKLAPSAPISLEAGGARGVVKALVDGWGSTMMRGLSARPMSLTELDRLILDLSYPALERRLSSMRMAGLIEARPGAGSGTPYVVTDWARRGVLPLAAAASCEAIHLGAEAPPVTDIDIEAAFMLATPLVNLPAELAGSCQLEVEADPKQALEATGVQVAVEAGRVVSCECELGPSPSGFACGSAAHWFVAILDGTASALSFGGSPKLSEAMVDGLHSALAGR